MNTALSAKPENQHLRSASRDRVVQSENNSFPSRASRTASFLFILLLALTFRLSSIRTTAPGPDEHHWLNRSSILLQRVENGSWSVATTHLGHPGIPAAIVMAVGEAVATAWNSELEAEQYSKWHIDPLSAARIAVVLFSSLIFLVMIACSTRWLGITAAMLGSLFLALDCQHIALTRIAHIDGTLTLLATTCLFLGFAAERSENLSLKVSAGVFWGLAIATKPTAAALIGILFLYKIFRRIFCQRFYPSPLPILDWSDLWAVIVGHFVLGLLYTKLWDPYNTYISRHRILPFASDVINQGSETLSSHPLLLGAIVVLSALSFITVILSPKKGRKFHATMLIFTTCFLLLTCWKFPVVSGNIVRFWYWVAGLSHRNHEAYGMVWSAPGYGYLEHWLRRLPSVVLLGLLPAIILLARQLRQRRSQTDAERTAFLFALLVAPIIWCLPLSISNKQTIRYAVPMYPAVFLFSAWGYVEFWKLLSRRLQPRKTIEGAFSYVPSLFAFIVVCIQANTALSWAPNYSAYFNSLSGGIHAALGRGYVLQPVGYEKAIQFVHERAVSSGEEQKVEVIGDLELMKFAYTRMYAKESRNLVKFEAFRDGYGATWVLEFPSISHRQDIHLDENPIFETALALEEHGAVVFRVYKVNPPDFRQPQVLSVTKGTRRMGRLEEFGEDGKNTIATPKFAAAGYIHFNQFVRLPAGRYRIDYALALHPDAKPLLPLSPQEGLLRLELTSSCTRTIPGAEVSSFKLIPISLECSFSQEVRAQISVYWFGKIPVRLGNISSQQIEATP